MSSIEPSLNMLFKWHFQCIHDIVQTGLKSALREFVTEHNRLRLRLRLRLREGERISRFVMIFEMGRFDAYTIRGLSTGEARAQETLVSNDHVLINIWLIVLVFL